MGYHDHHNFMDITQIIFAVPLLLALVGYLVSVALTSRRYKKKWPLMRTVYWILGMLCAAIAVIGPLAERAHLDFTSHMVSHLLLGMLAPLLVVVSAPMTLFLRTMKVGSARRLSLLLKGWTAGIFTHPIVTTILNVGGLWVVYTTGPYMMIQQNMDGHKT